MRYFEFYNLNTCYICSLNILIKKQAPTLDTIEKNIINTQSNVEGANSNLKMALNYKAMGKTAASGALIGTVIGGPIGFFAGFLK